MSDIDTVARARYAFYRLVGSDSDDSELVALGEATDDVAYLYLTRGTRRAQRWMIANGYGGWRKRSSALSWTGTDATTGGRYQTLPSDFLRAYGNQRRSALVEANGDRWGCEVDPEEDHFKGDGYYIRGEELWLTRGATPPTTLYLDFHYRHPVWTSGVTIDFPLEARALFVAEAANVAKEENWLPGGREMEAKIERALLRAREEARDISRATKSPRTFRKPPRYGNRW